MKLVIQEKNWKKWRVVISSCIGSTRTFWELADQPSRISAKTLRTASSSYISWMIWIQKNAHSPASKSLMMKNVLSSQSKTRTDLAAKMLLQQETSAKETTRSTKSWLLRSSPKWFVNTRKWWLPAMPNWKGKFKKEKSPLKPRSLLQKMSGSEDLNPPTVETAKMASKKLKTSSKAMTFDRT